MNDISQKINPWIHVQVWVKFHRSHSLGFLSWGCTRVSISFTWGQEVSEFKKKKLFLPIWKTWIYLLVPRALQSNEAFKVVHTSSFYYLTTAFWDHAFLTSVHVTVSLIIYIAFSHFNNILAFVSRKEYTKVISTSLKTIPVFETLCLDHRHPSHWLQISLYM